jgi:hypothetical protein
MARFQSNGPFTPSPGSIIQIVRPLESIAETQLQLHPALLQLAVKLDIGCRRGLAPEVGFEPTTNRLTADRSTTELLWIAMRSIERR